MRILPAIAAILALVTPARADEQAILEKGRNATDAFIAGNLDHLWQAMTPGLQAVFGERAGLSSFHEQVLAGLGEQREIESETVSLENGFNIYRQVAGWSETPTGVMTQWSFDASGAIAGFLITEVQGAASDYLDYETQADLRLPFNGEWYVFWGGRVLEDNYHIIDVGQRFAYDFIIHDADGNSYSGEKDRLESYYCWGAEILAPADGRVIAAVGDLPDQLIGETDAQNPAGNHVILELAENEYAFLVHLQAGSLRVREGDTVSQGDVLGLCGNSGNTSEPHLHFHLQTTPDLMNGEGLPAQFQSYLADGEPVDRGEPIRGQIVAAQD
ncbi:M23 family metallopeptidase [Pelagibacterium lentulum]|uniref:M23ase beta-sheet core domain-containing protein n=1 Tax=Pelagibacterium lentulum TaxID=2029865 RepID=A0A916VZI5_9HYPH|nr:M23 family metallopeptidase [Pelagibacterium lentulum]GGA54261.1 hypothetical protein GCM10011499_25540 [Pelagibacterium lentulum]